MAPDPPPDLARVGSRSARCPVAIHSRFRRGPPAGPVDRRAAWRAGPGRLDGALVHGADRWTGDELARTRAARFYRPNGPCAGPPDQRRARRAGLAPLRGTTGPLGGPPAAAGPTGPAWHGVADPL